MLTENQLSKYFKFDVLPIADNGIFWDGKPTTLSNIPKWQIHLTQRFGENLVDYSQFNLKGHNGIDIGFLEGCPIVAPCDLWITYLQDSAGYGKNVWGETESKQINGDYYKLELCFGHNKEMVAKSNNWSKKGSSLSFGDSTGFSTGDHSHIGVRPYVKKSGKTIWEQMFPNNGYLGWINPEPFFPKMYKIGEKNTNYMEEFKEKHDGKLVFNNDTGEIGWFYNDKLRIPDQDRLAKMLASYLIRKEGVHIADVEWDKLDKDKF